MSHRVAIRQIERQRAFLLVAGLDLVFAALDMFRGGERILAVAHGTLLAAMVCGAVAATRVSPQKARLATAITVIAGLFALAFLADQTGGTQGRYFPYFVAVPFVIALLAPDDLPLVALGGGGTLAAGLAVAVPHGSGLEYSLFWSGQMVASSALAMYGTAMYRRIVASEREAEEKERLLRERVTAAERLAAIGTLAAGVGHEINNPLAYVKANLDWLRDEPLSSAASAEERRNALAECQHGIERIQATVADLRLLARREEDSRDEVTPLQAVDEALKIARVRTKTAAEVIRDVAPDLPLVHASRRRVVQVLVNLLVNAADAVQGRPDGARSIRIWAKAEERWVLIGVDDSGPGLSPEVRTRLFEPLFTTKEPGSGTGLGLLLSREYVEKAGGSLTAGDAPGGGARFVVKLPQPPPR